MMKTNNLTASLIGSVVVCRFHGCRLWGEATQ